MFLLLKGERESRLDPNFYRLDFRALSEKIRKNNVQRLGEIVKFSSESWNQEDFFNDTFPYIEISEIDIVSGEIKSVSEILINEAPSRAKMIVRENDIIISTTRPNRGAIAKIDKQINFSIASTGFAVIRALKTDKISRDFLFYALRQNFSLSQMEQRSSGGSYPAITQEELSNLLIPIPSKETQQTIINIFEKAYAIKKDNEEKVNALLASIDDYLLAELGIVLLEKVENTLKNRAFLKSSRDILGERFDANYNHITHSKNIAVIQNSRFQVFTLKEITKAVFQGVGRNIDENSPYILLKVKNIKRNFEIDFDDTEPIGDFPKNKILVRGDIITPCIGEAVKQIKFSVFDGEENKYLVDNNTGVIRPINTVNPDYVNYCLCNSIGKIQIKRFIGGGGVPFLGSENLKRFIIPLPPLPIQKEIADHITNIRQQAKNLQNEAKTAIEEAKRTVEAMILGE